MVRCAIWRSELRSRPIESSIKPLSDALYPGNLGGNRSREWSCAWTNTMHLRDPSYTGPTGIMTVGDGPSYHGFAIN